MKILTIGDIVGESGVEKFKKELPKIKSEYNVDFIIVNAENSAGGMGITTKIFNELVNLNVDAITMGNHTWGKRTDMNVLSDNPFTRATKLIDAMTNSCDMIFIEFHAEATAEKIAMANYLDGKVTAVYGTHTHVQTADETILNGGTAYITDIGMTGPINSVIGMDVEASIKRFVTSLPVRYKLADGKCMLNGCIFEVDDETCRVVNINRIIRK